MGIHTLCRRESGKLRLRVLRPAVGLLGLIAVCAATTMPGCSSSNSNTNEQDAANLNSDPALDPALAQSGDPALTDPASIPPADAGVPPTEAAPVDLAQNTGNVDTSLGPDGLPLAQSGDTSAPSDAPPPSSDAAAPSFAGDTTTASTTAGDLGSQAATTASAGVTGQQEATKVVAADSDRGPAANEEKKLADESSRRSSGDSKGTTTSKKSRKSKKHAKKKATDAAALEKAELAAIASDNHLENPGAFPETGELSPTKGAQPFQQEKPAVRTPIDPNTLVNNNPPAAANPAPAAPVAPAAPAVAPPAASTELGRNPAQFSENSGGEAGLKEKLFENRILIGAGAFAIALAALGRLIWLRRRQSEDEV